MKSDEALLLDMILAARDAQAFVRHMDEDEFRTSRLHQNAVVRSLEIIGEAASRVSPATRGRLYSIHWSEMIGMRNRLIHNYAGVRLSVVWDVVKNHLPSLVDAIEPMVPPPIADQRESGT